MNMTTNENSSYCYKATQQITIHNGLVPDQTISVGESVIAREQKNDLIFITAKTDDTFGCWITKEDLLASVDMTSVRLYLGECENCGCDLKEIPNGGWGVGWVCRSCAIRISRGYD